MISCDYKELLDKSTQLNKIFSKITKTLMEIEDDGDLLMQLSNWDSVTRDYFNQKFNMVKKNDEIIGNLVLNVNSYLETVIDNYSSLEQGLNNAFKF